MLRLFIVISYLIASAFNCSNASNSEKQRDFSKMTCRQLVLHMLDESSHYDQFADKRISLECFNERYSLSIITLCCVRRAGIDKNGIYANYELDLDKRKLTEPGLEIPLQIKINTDYIPFIKEKCTPEENVYGVPGHRPE